MVAAIATQLMTGGRGLAGLTSDVVGVAAALLGFAVVYVSRLTFDGSTRTL
jgi:hypothetical protein